MVTFMPTKGGLKGTMLRSAVGITHVLQVPDFSHPSGFTQVNQKSTQLASSYGSTWVVLWLLLFRSAPSTFPIINGPPIGVRFRESLVVRLYSEIDQIHLSIEAQCVTTLLPLGDCHINRHHFRR